MIKLPIDINKDKPQLLVFLGLIVVLVLVLYVYLLLGPEITWLTDALSRTGKEMADVKSAESLISKIPQFKKNIESYKKKVDFYEKRLPAEQEIPNLLGNLSGMAKKSGIKIIGITPLPLTVKDQMLQKGKIYKEIPILISAKSGYHELGAFLSDLENADRFMKVVDIEIRTNKATPKKHDMELVVCTYVLLEGK